LAHDDDELESFPEFIEPWLTSMQKKWLSLA
jgi:hypothetical protein